MKQLNKNISVIIPTYQPKAYLKKCFDSLEAQTLSKDRFCVYIALNGDKYPYEDEVLSLLRIYNFEFKYIYIKKAGVSNARNKLLDCSDEAFITFIDDDDLISPNYLSDLLEVTTEEYVGIAKVYRFKKNIEAVIKISISELYDKLPLLETSKIKAWRYYSPTCAKMIHRSMIGDIKFSENLEIAEDSLFFITISKNIKGFCKSKENTYYYYLDRHNSVSNAKMSLKNRVKNNAFFIGECIKLLTHSKYNRLFVLSMIVLKLRYFLWVFVKSLLHKIGV